jgi:hypothetical protein
LIPGKEGLSAPVIASPDPFQRFGVVHLLYLLYVGRLAAVTSRDPAARLIPAGTTLWPDPVMRVRASLNR